MLNFFYLFEQKNKSAEIKTFPLKFQKEICKNFQKFWKKIWLNFDDFFFNLYFG